MAEPTYIAQTSNYGTFPDQRSWFLAQAKLGRESGAMFFRASIHTEIDNLILIEGWSTVPDDQGEPRWKVEVAK